MDRPRRTIKKPQKFQEEETPKVTKTRKRITKKDDKENVNPEEENFKKPSQDTSKKKIAERTKKTKENEVSPDVRIVKTRPANISKVTASKKTGGDSQVRILTAIQDAQIMLNAIRGNSVNTVEEDNREVLNASQDKNVITVEDNGGVQDNSIIVVECEEIVIAEDEESELEEEGESEEEEESEDEVGSDIEVEEESVFEESQVEVDERGETTMDEDLLLGLGTLSVTDVGTSVPRTVPVVPVVKNTSGKYEAQYSKTSRAGCRLCSEKILKGDFRIGKTVHIDYGAYGGPGLAWWHINCFFRQHNHPMKWKDFNGVEDLKVDDQKKLHLKAFRCPMPDDLAKQVTSTLQSVQTESRQNVQREQACKQQEDETRIRIVSDSTAEELIREKVAKVIEKKTVEQLKTIIKKNGIPVEKPDAGRGKSKAPKKADYQNSIINAKPLMSIGSLVQRAIRKHIKVDELKIMLEKAGLARTGTKPELTKRLLGTFPGNFGEESEDEGTTKNGRKKYNDFHFDDCYMSRHDIYEKDEDDPGIVKAARSGDLNEIKEILRKTVRPLATLNSSRKWTEVEEKYGYDKSWGWHGETPLLAATRVGHYQVVHYLLTQEADPTLEGCISCDAHESPITAVDKIITSQSQGTNKLVYIGSAEYQANTILSRIKKWAIIKELLVAASPHWSKASYASSSYSDARKTSFARMPNKPRNSQQLQNALADISLEIQVDAVQKSELAKKIEKAREEEMDRVRLMMQKSKEEIERKKIEREEQNKEMERQRKQRAEEWKQKEQEKKQREKKEREERERIKKEFMDKVRSASQQSNICAGTSGNSQPAQVRTTTTPIATLPQTNNTQHNEMDLSDDGVLYHGSLVNWRGSFGFLKLDSPFTWVSNVFVHISDVTSLRHRCRAGERFQFHLTRSVRKKDSLQAVNASILEC